MHGVELYQEGAAIRSRDTMAIPYTYHTTSALFPESSSRGEHWVRDRPHPVEQPSTNRDTLSRTLVTYIREVSPGLLEDGRLTVSHPLVARYLDALVIDYIRKTEPSGGGPSSSLIQQDEHGDEAVGCPDDVGALIGQKLTAVECAAIFSLAALDILDKTSHKAHLALWNLQVRSRTAQTIERIHDLDPCPIYFPAYVWVGFQKSLFRVDARHNFEIQRATHDDPDPRRRRRLARQARPTTRASRRRAAAAQAAKALKAAANGGDPAPAVPRVTKPRTRKAAATASAEPTAPTRRSQRRTVTNKKSPLQQSTTAEDIATKVERVATPVLATPAPEPNRKGTEANVDIETTEQQPEVITAPAKRSRKSRSAPSRTRKRVVARTTATVAASAPQPEPSATPEADSPANSLQPSRSSTAVASSEEPDKVVVIVPEENPKTAGKKRKADELDETEEPKGEEGPRRKSPRTSRRTVKGEALDAEIKAEKNVKRTRTRKR